MHSMPYKSNNRDKHIADLVLSLVDLFQRISIVSLLTSRKVLKLEFLKTQRQIYYFLVFGACLWYK